MQVFNLRTLGAVYVASADGAPLGGAAGQRRLLGLLAVLAVAGDSGLSRDKVVGLLWPEADAERARHSLTQALYSARRALGADDLFAVAADVRLNPARLRSDVQDLESALDAGDLRTAADLYRGPFLDGFFLAGSAEFEQWVSRERTRLEDRVASALEHLAERAQAAGELRSAVEWRKRLAALRPLDSSVAVKLMTALAAAGDRAGALQHARVHDLLLREELGIGADPAVAALAGRLRAPAASVSVEPRLPTLNHEPDAVPAGEPTGAAAPTAAPAEAPAEAPTGAPPPPIPVVASPAAPDAQPERAANEAAGTARPRAPGAPLRWRRRWAAVAAAALGAVAAALGAPGVLRRERPTTAAPVATRSEPRQAVVVAPFRVAGASESLAYLRDGLVELLSTRLADDSAARSVDAGAVLSAWRAAGLAASADVPRDTIVGLAARLGAERVVIGSVVGTRSHAVLSAQVVSVPSGAVTREATVEGPTDSVSALVDRLAAKLLVLDAGEDASLASQTTTSLTALRAFLAGQAAFRAGEYAVALRQYRRTLDLDSAFALAALQLARTADRLHTDEQRDAGIARAWRFRAALGERDEAVLLALAGPRYPAPSPATLQRGAWERLVTRFPDDAEAWYVLAARLFHQGAVAGVPTPHARAVFALTRALDLDPGNVPARTLLAQLAAGQPGDPAAGAIPGPRALQNAGGPLGPFLRWRVAIARGDSASLVAVRDTLRRLEPATLRALARASQFDAVALGDARRALGELRSRTAQTSERVEIAVAHHSLALNEGRLRDARNALDRIKDLQPGSGAHLRLQVLDALYAGVGQSAAAAAAADLARRVAAQPAARAVDAADACVLAQWRLARGDTAGVQAAVAGLRAATDAEPHYVAVVAPPAACADLLDAALAVTVGRGDARAVVARLDSLALTDAVAGDAAAYAPLLIARLHSRLGDTAGALAAIRKRTYMVGWPRYLAATLREEGAYAAAAAAPDIARQAYGRFLVLRADSDAELARETAAVREAVAALPARPTDTGAPARR